jgi:phosphopantothenoylcysteine decarboxylase/phosphopantothenate--cysteine ligase
MVSQLTQAGVNVKVALSKSAQKFVGAATFHGLSGNPVVTDLFAPDGDPEPHVQLGDWAELILVAPATANLLAKIAEGESSDLIPAIILAARCPIVLAPAMNDAMWAKEIVQQNLSLLKARGVAVIEPEVGRLASGNIGAGRLASAGRIFPALENVWRTTHDMAGMRVLVSAGGTREPIDPVRYISNYSSGKMGFAIAKAAADRGAEVVLVSTAQHPEQVGVQVISVETAVQMMAALKEELPNTNILVMVAAVADYRPKQMSHTKIKREGRETLSLELEQNPDVVSELSHSPGADQIFKLGFAAEDSDIEAHAVVKIQRKGLDAIFVNDISRKDIAFGSDFNAGTLVFKNGDTQDFDRTTKDELAKALLTAVQARIPSRV